MSERFSSWGRTTRSKISSPRSASSDVSSDMALGTACNGGTTLFLRRWLHVFPEMDPTQALRWPPWIHSTRADAMLFAANRRVPTARRCE
jgi:hypothetical protein